MKTTQNIGEKIRLLRLQRGMSQEQLALHSGINTSYLGQVERGEKNPTIKTLEKIAIGLDTPLGNLFVIEEYPNGHANHNNSVLTVLTHDALRQLIMDTLNTNASITHLSCKDKP